MEPEEPQRRQEEPEEPGNHPPQQRLRKDDLVQSLDDPNRLGYVVRVPDSDSESDSEDEDEDDDDDDDEELTPGTSRVSWLNSSHRPERLENSRLHLLDRSFNHGDIVVLASDPLTQSGFVSALHLSADVAFRYADVSWTLRDVDSTRLRRIRPLMEGDLVLRDHWLGRVDEVVDNVTLAFDDGSRCVVARADPETLICKRSPEEESETLVDYYPGATVRERSLTSLVYRRAKWLRGSWTHGKKEATVVRVATSYVMVTWLSSGSGGRSSPGEPEEKQKPRDLVLLPRFADSEWGVGDYTLEVEADRAGLIGELRKLRKFQVSRPGKRVKKLSTEKLLKKVLRDGYSGRIVSTRTFADVVWQDGSRGLRIPTTELEDAGPFKFNDFWPESYVVESVGEAEVPRLGVVRSVNVKQRTARVRWFKPAPPEVLGEFAGEETVSVFELADHPDYRYNIGDIVVRLSPSQEKGGGAAREAGEEAGESAPAAGNADEKPGESSEEAGETDEESGESEAEAEVKAGEPEAAATWKPFETGVETEEKPGEQEAATVGGTGVTPQSQGEAGEPEAATAKKPGEFEADNLSWVGTIVGYELGDIEVKWANQVVSKVGPHSLYVVHRPDSDDSSDDDDDDDARSWETVGSDEERRILEDPDVPPPAEPEKSSSQEKSALNVVLGFASRVFSAVSGIATKGLFIKGGPSETNPPEEDGSRLENGDLSQQEPEVKKPEENQAEEKNPGEEKVGSSEAGKPEDEEEFSSQNFVAKPGEDIKQFDVVHDATDHYFVERTCTDAEARTWLKAVHQEWNILQKNLPDSIFVRMYEDRMNLVRAVIVGAAGTPYADGLFVFDFHLPDGYPYYPPVGHYHSFGLYLNPNLYADGKICLSLLNTWRGKDTEMWTPGASNILQVLLSIQGLVLNSKPYFNEADFDRYVGTDGGELNAIEYNESAFILTCKTILNLLRRPPMHLEELIKAHFRSRATKILATCRAYYNGVPVGGSGTDSGSAEESSTAEAPAGFKLLIRKVVPMLVAAFTEIGAAGCEEFLIAD